MRDWFLKYFESVTNAGIAYMLFHFFEFFHINIFGYKYYCIGLMLIVSFFFMRIIFSTIEKAKPIQVKQSKPVDYQEYIEWQKNNKPEEQKQIKADFTK